MAEPIWKDYYVNFGNVTSVDYEIRLTDGTTIFSGRSYRRPNETSLQVKINDICADYLESLHKDKLNLTEGFVSNDIAKEFRVFNSSGTLIKSVTFVNDWSYDYDRKDTGVLSDPINRIFDVRMPLMYSISKAQTILVEAQDTKADFSIDFSSDFYIGNDLNREVVAEGAGTLTLKNIFTEKGDVKVGGILYTGLRTCNTHALYYINAYGGWDFLLLEGRTIEKDSYTRQEHQREYDNSDIADRGTKNQLNEVVKSYVLHTGWMKNNEAAKMHHLLGSTDVYLYDLEKGRMIPVVITDNECKYKTFQNEDGKLVEYEINVKVAKQMIRR